MSTTNSNTTEITVKVVDRFRAYIQPIPSIKKGAVPPYTGEWLETYEEARADLETRLVGGGTGFVAEIEKVSMTDLSWNELVALKAALAKANA